MSEGKGDFPPVSNERKVHPIRSSRVEAALGYASSLRQMKKMQRKSSEKKVLSQEEERKRLLEKTRKKIQRLANIG